ncbi:hypothetical protein OG497_37925 [Streptomyces sp. NBC_01242]|uniref:hypothetical protein n=1 Tax=Streptomyces sp. NBC_01242 TaxID=2903795 RepID=UPI0022544FA6|nr:hypothetical protein [Streptomyces sp. NBC_01242]MCX4799638.1 hypothetical protein [Streptomyces sp. NBC_01242]
MTTENHPAAAGNPPSVTAVIKFLKSAGFQHSYATESISEATGSGACVRAAGRHSGIVSVSWSEGDHDFVRRMSALGAVSASEVPEHPEARDHAREYAEALAPRYHVRVDGTHVYVSARPELPARPPTVPIATTVRKALAAAGVEEDSRRHGWLFRVVDQPDHTRVAVRSDETLAAVRSALEAEGWIFEQSETWQHYALKITGSTPDRPARLRALRAERAARPPAPAVEEPPAVEPPAPAPAPVEPVAAEEVQRTPRHYSRSGVAYAVGMRVTYRDRTGFWRHGEIIEISPAPDGGERRVHFRVDAYQVAPARRAAKHMPNRPGKRCPSLDSDDVWVVALDDKDLGCERIE